MTRRLRIMSLLIPALVLGGVLAAFGFVVVRLYHSAYDQRARGPMLYRALEEELAAGLEPSDSSLRRAIVVGEDSVVLRRRGEFLTVRFDTLAIVDTGHSPSLREGGFVSDHVRRYNTIQRRRVGDVQDRFVRRGASLGPLVDLREKENPSVFRTRIRFVDDSSGDGYRSTLSSRAATTGMRVASPFESRREVMITARRATERFAFVGLDTTVTLTGKGTTPGGRRGCAFLVREDSAGIQCRKPGSARPEILMALDKQGHPGSLRMFRRDSVFYDGKLVPHGPQLPIRRGGLIRLPSRILGQPGEPMALEQTVSGILAGTQWVNGRVVWRQNADWDTPIARQLVSASGFGLMSALSTPRVVPLSLDEQLSRELQAELESFIKAQPQARDLSFAVGLIANLANGEILAAPEVNHRYADAPSSVLRSVNVGSAIKPLLAAATLVSFPELASLQIRNPGGRVNELWGYPLSSDFETGAKCAVGWIDLRRFLECSSNVYAASLVSAGLQPRSHGRVALEYRSGAVYRLSAREESDRQPRLPLEPDLTIHPESLFASVLSHGLDELFGITTSLEEASVDPGDSTVWEGLIDAAGNPVRVPSGLWPDRSRVGLAYQGRRSTLRRLAAIAIGAGEARLTPIDLTQAFGRLVSDRALVLRFVPTDTGVAPAANHGLRSQRWYSTFMAGLRGVGETGTAAGTGAIVRRVLGPNIAFYGKTGTLNAPASALRRSRDTVVRVDPVVATTLVFAVGNASRNGGAALSCGFVGTIYFRLNREVDRVEPLATAFANQRLWPVLRRHWNRLGACPAAARQTRTSGVRFTAARR
ncbi:MAG TPA: hypothetical protein VJ650_08510 [Gemmatimonadaceae bacterium]|nr:hypothetical protein [Gemmatimonadaceae bacterium]